MWHIYTIEHSAIKRNKIGLFVVMWMNLESVIQSKVSQKEKNKCLMLMHICRIQKNDMDEPICRIGIETQIQRMDVWTWKGRYVLNWEIESDIYTLPCVRLIASGDLLYSTGSLAWYSVITQMGEMGGWEGGIGRGDVCILVADSVCCTAETNATL